MGLNDLLNLRIVSAKTILLISFLLVQSCSNDERLEGYRLSVLEEQKFYETNKKNYRLALGKPKKNSSWTHGGGQASHSLGNIAFSAKGKFTSHTKSESWSKGVIF